MSAHRRRRHSPAGCDRLQPFCSTKTAQCSVPLIMIICARHSVAASRDSPRKLSDCQARMLPLANGALAPSMSNNFVNLNGPHEDHMDTPRYL
jgi:hypothetical protein